MWVYWPLLSGGDRSWSDCVGAGMNAIRIGAAVELLYIRIGCSRSESSRQVYREKEEGTINGHLVLLWSARGIIISGEHCRCD